jgi:hypothetical protein
MTTFLRQVRRSALVLVVAGAGIAACGGDDTLSSSETTAASGTPDEGGDTIVETVGGARGEVLAAAVDSTESGSARMAVAVDFAGIFSFAADGEMDFDAGDMAIRMDLTEMLSAIKELAGASGADLGELDELGAGGDLVFEVRQVAGIMYMRMPGLLAGEAGFPNTEWPDTEWIAVDIDAALESSGLSASTLDQLREQSDPSQYLRFLLAASDDVELVGEEEVRGVPTKHYAGTLDLTDAFDALPDEIRADLEEQLGDVDDALSTLGEQFGLDALPFDVWVDHDRRLRKFVITMDMASIIEETGDDMPPGFGGEVSMSFELYDYGVDVEIEAPPDDDVTVLDPDEFASLGD